MKTGFQQDIGTPIFIAALFTIAKIWKQPKYPRMDKWIKTVVYIHTLNITHHGKGRYPIIYDNADGP